MVWKLAASSVKRKWACGWIAKAPPQKATKVLRERMMPCEALKTPLEATQPFSRTQLPKSSETPCFLKMKPSCPRCSARV
eukprot:15464041-Alexandrium_andersonii.AAC.1